MYVNHFSYNVTAYGGLPVYENVVNPGRGFYKHSGTYSSNFQPLTVSLISFTNVNDGAGGDIIAATTDDEIDYNSDYDDDDMMMKMVMMNGMKGLLPLGDK